MCFRCRPSGRRGVWRHTCRFWFRPLRWTALWRLASEKPRQLDCVVISWMAALTRGMTKVSIDGRSMRVKLVDRPGGGLVKAEADDLLHLADHAARAKLRREAEQAAEKGVGTAHEDRSDADETLSRGLKRFLIAWVPWRLR